MRNALLILWLVLFPSLAHAQSHPRAARALFLLSPESPVILVGRDRAWLPATRPDEPLTICAGARCRPVRAIEACDAPRCPGSGRLAITEGTVADVGDYPTDRDGFHRERDALSTDAALASLVPYLQSHPSPAPTPARWNPSQTEQLRWELAAFVGGAMLAHEGSAAVHTMLAGGVHFLSGMRESDGPAGFVLPASIGFELHLHALPGRLDRQDDEAILAIGLAPSMRFTIDGVLRLPGFLSLVVPEIGAIGGTDRPVAMYLSWSLPVDLLIDEHVALSARAAVMMIDDWVDGDAVEAVLSLSLGAVFR